MQFLIIVTSPGYDTNEDPGLLDITYRQMQPGLDITNTQTTGQITNQMKSAQILNLDFQYTINFSPKFNIGINAGLIGANNIRTLYRISAHGKLYYQEETFNPDGTSSGLNEYLIDTEPVELIFDFIFGGKIEVCPEFFITPRLAVNASIGYMLTLPAELWGVNAKYANWEFTESSAASGYNDVASDTYYNFDPRKMPDGSTWKMDLSGLYGGISISVFF